jgi:hypothetical protein
VFVARNETERRTIHSDDCAASLARYPLILDPLETGFSRVLIASMVFEDPNNSRMARNGWSFDLMFLARPRPN